LKPFLARLGGFIAVQLALAALAVGAWSRLPEPAGYLAASLDKERRLREAPGARLVLVGGSATAFGVDSGEIERRLGRPAVNLGLYAPLGLEFMLREAEAGLRAGDVVLVSPEFPVLKGGTAPAVLEQLLQVNPGAIRHVGAEDLKNLLDRGHGFLGVELRRALAALFRAPEEESAVPPYSRGSFDLRGDVVAHHGRGSSAEGVAPYDLPEPGSPAFEEAVRGINAFGRRLRARGVRVFHAWPALIDEEAELKGTELREVQKALVEGLTIPSLGEPGRFLFPRGEFFDSNFHLTEEGKRHRTGLLLAALEERLRQAD
jgi:hypothetical protein